MVDTLGELWVTDSELSTPADTEAETVGLEWVIENAPGVVLPDTVTDTVGDVWVIW